MSVPDDNPAPDGCEPLGDGDDTALDEESSGSEAVTHQHKIGKRVSSRRLDKYLCGRHPQLSRTVVQRYIKQGQVTVNGLPTKASYEPAPGDTVEIVLPPPVPTHIVPQDIPLDVVYEDEWMLGVNKQIGIVCHPARAIQTGTVANAVAFHCGSIQTEGDPLRPGIVHRLDKNTSGIMLVAKCDEATWRLSRQFEKRTVRKQYFAICEGELSLDGDIINRPLAPAPDTTARMVTPGANPPRQAMFKEAITEYRVGQRYRGYTTVDLFPKTGRTHQLRVHMAYIGHPLVGDTLYGGHVISEHDITDHGSDEPLLEFQALHARRIQFVHPILEKPMDLQAPLPPRLQRILDLLDTHRRPAGG